MRTAKIVLASAAAGALVTITTSAFAGSGVGGVFNLGQANTVNAESSLTGSTSGGPQLRVENAATTQNAFGVLGRITAGAPGTASAGVRGINSATNGNGFGVWGFHQGAGIGVFGETPTGTGVTGRHTGSSGTTPGVHGQTASTAPGAVGVLGEVSAGAPGAGAAGVKGTNAAASGYGVFGESAGGTGVLGRGARTGASVFSPLTGMYACAEPAGASACTLVPPLGSGGGIAGSFHSTAALGIGVHACAGIGCAITVGPSAYGGQFRAGGAGAVGVLGDALSGADGGIGVKGVANGGPNAVGVLGSSLGGLAGRFQGNVHVTGKLTRAYTNGTANQSTPIAYGTVRATDGLLLSGTPNVSSSYDATNHRYLITIAEETYSTSGYITSVTPTTSAQPRFATTTATGGQLSVRIFDANGGLQQAQFSFLTYKP